MRVNRRRILGTVASAAVLSSLLGRVAAHSTPVAATGVVPGYAIARVRALPTPNWQPPSSPTCWRPFCRPRLSCRAMLATSSARMSPTPRPSSP